MCLLWYLATKLYKLCVFHSYYITCCYLPLYIWRILKHGHYDRSEDAMLTEVIQELVTATDENIYILMHNLDYTMGRWTDEDPSLRNVQR